MVRRLNSHVVVVSSCNVKLLFRCCWHGLTHLPYQPWCKICVRARGRENRHVSLSQNQPGTPVIQYDYCFLKTEEDDPMVTVLVATDTVYKQMVAIPLEKKGNRDPFASRSLAAFARCVGHPKVIIQRDSEHSLMAVIHDACALLTAATPRTSLVNSEGSNGAAERGLALCVFTCWAEQTLQWAVICRSRRGW